jgi:phage host-nuclease inhibitor protein Gam
MSKRSKKPKSSLRSIDDCNRAMREIALYEIEIEKIQGECDEAVNTALARAHRLAKPRLERKHALIADLAAYCEEHKDALTVGGKTVEMLFGRFGWRLSPPALKIAKGFKVDGKKATWEALVALVKEKLGAAYIQVKETVKRDEIKAAGFDDGELLAAGLAIEQDDEWWYEVDRTALATPGVRAGGSAAPAEGRR